MKIVFEKCQWCGQPLAWMPEAVEEDSLTCQDMIDIEDQKPVLFDEGRHKRHVCREEGDQ